MFINYSNPSSNAESICDNSCPILINSCGYYRLKKQANLLTTRPHGRLDYQIIYIASGHGVFYFDDMDELAGKRRKLAQTKAPGSNDGFAGYCYQFRTGSRLCPV